ncbi:hypothetical protein DK871_27555 [Pseudomonas sp. L13]|nr:hypothetical protein [Pseudomonas sp. L13]
MAGSISVGASLLAKNTQAPRLSRKYALSLTFFASKLAPTGVLMTVRRWCGSRTAHCAQAPGQCRAESSWHSARSGWSGFHR